MANFWDFSRTDSPSPTLEQMSEKFNESLQELQGFRSENQNRGVVVDQTGEGVLTRSQAQQLAANKVENLDSRNGHLEVEKSKISNDSVSVNSDNSSEHIGDLSNGSDTEQNLNAEADHTTNNVAQSKSESEHLMAPFVKEALVAENQDLKAFIIKTHFRKMKNFM